MKRSLGTPAGVHQIGPKTSDNSTSTGSHMKKIKRDGSRPKQLRRGASHASSAQEYMKSEWTCDELDLNKQMTSLCDLAQDKIKLVEELFSIFSILELKEFTPNILKEYSVNQLKELCLEELYTISTSKIKFITEGNDPEDFVEPQTNIDDKAIGDTSDGIQLSVDDNEYSDFLGAENLEPRRAKKEVKDAEVQANWSSLESSSSDDSHSDHKDGEGWMNLWKLEQMEILELEMRARAIRMLLKQEEEEGSAQKTTPETEPIESKQTINENKTTGESNAEKNDKNESENQRQDLEAGEVPDTEDDTNDKNIDRIEDNQNKTNIYNKQNLNIEKLDNYIHNSDQNRESEAENESIAFKVQSNDYKEKVDMNDDNEESNEKECDEDLEINEILESEGKSQLVVDREVNSEISQDPSIILLNDEFDEELDDNIEEDINNQICDKQSIISDNFDENLENKYINDCEPEVGTKSSESSGH